MQELNKLIMEEFNKNESEYKNDFIFINGIRGFEFILKHGNISGEYFNDYAALYI